MRRDGPGAHGERQRWSGVAEPIRWREGILTTGDGDEGAEGTPRRVVRRGYTFEGSPCTVAVQRRGRTARRPQRGTFFDEDRGREASVWMKGLVESDLWRDALS